MNEQLALFEIKKKQSAEVARKRKWENGFQKWSDYQGVYGDDYYGCCGYGSMCDYCGDNSFGRPCVRALNKMLRETGENIDYDRMTYEEVWEGARA